MLMYFHQPPKKDFSVKEPRALLRLLESLDMIGTVFFLPSIVCLLLVLQWAGTEYAWNSWRVILLLCIFSIGFVAWVVVQLRGGDRATLPPRIIRQRSIAAVMWFISCIMGVLVIFLSYVPIWFQAVLGTSAYQSGINNLTNTIATAIIAVSAGFIVSHPFPRALNN